MDLHGIARTLLAAFCAIQGAATMALDLNRTHAAHPRWLGHARFHVVWQTGTTAALAGVEIWLLSFRGPLAAERFYLAALLALLPIFGFFAALLTRRIYGGALFDPGGILPLSLTVRGRHMRVDMNLVAEVAGALTVAALVAIFRYAHSSL
jgi:hypothetical protein